MKNLFLFIALAFVCLSFTKDDNTILWNETTKLAWTDFKGNPNNSSPYKAFTESNIHTEISAKNNEANISIKVFFDKNKSWVKEANNAELLKHEQTHFDITELWARKFRQKLKGKTFSFKSFQNDLNTIQAGIFKDSKEMQVLYDKETEHSVNTANQQKWNKKITEELKNLGEFSATEISCTLTN
jgi:lipopolysaccharide export LptBFGC system permease protein LptF